MAAIPDDCERTATVALPTAASPGFISGEVGISAALDACSTVYGLPLLNAFWDGQTNRQTDRHTDMNDRYTSLYALRPREVKMYMLCVSNLLQQICSTVSIDIYSICYGNDVGCHGV